MIEEFKETFLSKDFIWRPGQREAIKEIIDIYIDGKFKTVILDAPTGSGKSCIAMVCSYVFNKLNKTSYILTSELSLQDQYEKDFHRFNLDWGCVKGIDNYICVMNGEKNSLGACRISNRSPKSFSCYPECPYFSARDKASRTKTSVLNYSYYLIQQNYVNRNDNTQHLFPHRDVVFADEAHKLLDIVQNHFAPRIDKYFIYKIKKITNFFNTYKIKDHIEDQKNLERNISLLFRSENQNELFNILFKIKIILESYLISKGNLEDRVEELYSKKKPPKEWRNALSICDWLKDNHCKIEDYVNIIESTSTRNIIKNPNGNDELVFNCLEENYLMDNYFHAHSGFLVLMSATFSDPKVYMKSININNAKYVHVKNSFEFNRSPIYFYNVKRMSYKEIDNNLGWLYDKVDEIMSKHKAEKGIIHSVSFNLTNKIFNNVSKENQKRLIVYSGSDEKKMGLDMLKLEEGRVIIGPSLITGISLDDNLARFCIFGKIPYPSLNDRFVKAKMQLDYSSYLWKTIIEIQQGLGRAIRSKDDWCISYILDACFGDLLFKYSKFFPNELLERIKILK